jgi:hypothetical protein
MSRLVPALRQDGTRRRRRKGETASAFLVCAGMWPEDGSTPEGRAAAWLKVSATREERSRVDAAGRFAY